MEESQNLYGKIKTIYMIAHGKIKMLNMIIKDFSKFVI